MKSNLFMMIFTLSLPLILAHANESCVVNDVIPSNVTNLTKDLGKISSGLYKDITKFKVELDGEGKLSVFYENGEPKILKFTYRNKNGLTVIQRTFDEIEQGKKIAYENDKKPGESIIFEKGSSFKTNNSFNFKLSIRTSIKPVKYESYPIELKGNEQSPLVIANRKQCKVIALSPGVSFLSWDGTFKKVDFK